MLSITLVSAGKTKRSSSRRMFLFGWLQPFANNNVTSNHGPNRTALARLDVTNYVLILTKCNSFLSGAVFSYWLFYYLEPAANERILLCCRTFSNHSALPKKKKCGDTHICMKGTMTTTQRTSKKPAPAALITPNKNPSLTLLQTASRI